MSTAIFLITECCSVERCERMNSKGRCEEAEPAEWEAQAGLNGEQP